MTEQISPLLRNKSNTNNYYPITTAKNIIQDSDHKFVTETQIVNWNKLDEEKMDKSGGKINGNLIVEDLFIDTGKQIFFKENENSSLVMLQYDSNNTMFNIGCANSIINLRAQKVLINSSAELLSTDNYHNKLDTVYASKNHTHDYIPSSGGVLKGKFNIDNGFAITAPSYDSQDNIKEQYPPTIIGATYNYTSGSSADRYPSVFSIGSSSIDLVMQGKSITSLGKLNHRGDIEVDGDLYLTNSDKKLYTKTPNGNKVCLLQTVMNSSTQEIRFGNTDSLLRITGKGDPTYADSEKSTVYNLLHTGNISQCGIKDGIALLHENTPSIYTVDHEGTKQSAILSYNTNTNVLELGNYMASVKVGGDRVITENDLSEYLPLSGGTISGDLLMDDGSRILINPNSHIELYESGVGSILSFNGDYISFGSPRKYLSINCLNASINGDRILLQHNIENYVPMFKLLFSGSVSSTGIIYSKVNVNNCATSVEGYEEGKKLLKFTAPSTGNYLFIVRCTGTNGVNNYHIDVGESYYSTTRVCTNINETGATVYDIAKDGYKYVCVWSSSYKTYVCAEVSIIKLA